MPREAQVLLPDGRRMSLKELKEMQKSLEVPAKSEVSEEVSESVDIYSMTKKQLVGFAKEQGLEVGRMTKDEIILSLHKKEELDSL